MTIQRNLFPFLIISVIHLIGQILEEPLIHDVTKPFLIPALAYFFKKTCVPSPLNRLVYFALVFSWLGDVLLIFVPWNSLFFILGLGGFLIAQLIYTFININFIDDSNPKPIFTWQASFVAAYGIIYFILIKESLGAVLIPVAIYCAVITLMGVTAIGRLNRSNKESFDFVLLGALLFIISDSVIGLNRFAGPVDFAGPIVMSTYLLAQYLLVRGYRAFIEGLKE